MNFWQPYNRFFTVFFVVFLTPSALVLGGLQPAVKVLLSGTVERQAQSVQLAQAGLLNPGEVLQWTILSHNEGPAPAHHYKTIGEIPAHTVYVLGSAQAEGKVNILFSIDRGKNYVAKPMIEQKQPDGTVRQVAAPAALYTHIRYEWSDSLPTGKAVSAYYKVRVQ